MKLVQTGLCVQGTVLGHLVRDHVGGEACRSPVSLLEVCGASPFPKASGHVEGQDNGDNSHWGCCRMERSTLLYATGGPRGETARLILSECRGKHQLLVWKGGLP